MGFWQTPRTLAASRFVARFVDRYVVNSFAVRERVADNERVSREKIEIVRNGYSAPAPDGIEAERKRAADALPHGGPLVGIVANVRPIKRIDTLIRAFGRVASRHPAARLAIVGADGDTAQSPGSIAGLRRLAASLGVDERVTFTGAVDVAQAFVERFDVAVLCSESEGLSNAIIEYMAAGKPVVCTDAGGNPELVQEGVNGFLVPVGDDAALASRIVALLDDSATAQRMGAAGRARVEVRHSHLRMVDDQMACYDRLLAPRRRRGLTASAQTE
jgi:glycosyltransferase involved in cell wall biosynthesis